MSDETNASDTRTQDEGEKNLHDSYPDWRLFGLFVTQNVSDPEIQQSFIPNWNEGNWDRLDRDWPEWAKFVKSDLAEAEKEKEAQPEL